MDQNADIFPAYRLGAQFADGQRLTFDGRPSSRHKTAWRPRRRSTVIFAGTTA